MENHSYLKFAASNPTQGYGGVAVFVLVLQTLN
jgi:hypothetical protein